VNFSIPPLPILAFVAADLAFRFESAAS